MNFPHTATLRRSVSSNGKYMYQDHGIVQCFLQPLNDQDAQLYGITFSKGSYCYVPYATDVEMGDRVVVDGVTYGVKGLRKHNYGTLTHKRVALEEL